MGRIENLSRPQVGFIYATAVFLIITTLVMSVVLSQNGTLSKSLGNGMTGKEVVGLVGGVGVGLFTIFAGVVLYYKSKRGSSSQPTEVKSAPANVSHRFDIFPQGEISNRPIDLYITAHLANCYGDFNGARNHPPILCQCISDDSLDEEFGEGFFLTQEGTWRRKTVQWRDVRMIGGGRHVERLFAGRWNKLVSELGGKEEVTSKEMFRALTIANPIRRVDNRFKEPRTYILYTPHYETLLSESDHAK